MYKRRRFSNLGLHRFRLEFKFGAPHSPSSAIGQRDSQREEERGREREGRRESERGR